jgi:hypothetical protein
MLDPLVPGPSDGEQPIDRLTALLLVCTGVISTMCNGLLAYAGSGDAADGFDVQYTAHQLVREVLVELGERHSESELVVAAAVIEDSLNAICEGLLGADLDHPACEGRRRTRRVNARWR